MSIASLLRDRDQFQPHSAEWEWRNTTAWRLYDHARGGLLAHPTEPPADFGLDYLTEHRRAA